MRVQNLETLHEAKVDFYWMEFYIRYIPEFTVQFRKFSIQRSIYAPSSSSIAELEIWPLIAASNIAYLLSLLFALHIICTAPVVTKATRQSFSASPVTPHFCRLN